MEQRGMGCKLCERASGRIPSGIVLQDERVYAFVSQQQPNPCSVIVTTRAHIETVFDLDDTLAAALFQAVVRVARAIREASSAAGLTIVQMNGEAAGQTVPHVSMWLVPRLYGETPRDGVQVTWESREWSLRALDSLAADIRYMLDRS